MSLTLGKRHGEVAGLVLPDDFVTQSCGILARRGAGKTYTASVLMEEMIDAGLPVVALDPLGVMWGLRASADGKQPGLPVTILGGDHGDVPLEPTGGKVAATFIVEHPGAYVLDLSRFDSDAQQDRFATDFAKALYREQGKARTPLHLVVDEADSFAPQKPQRGQEPMLGAYEAIVRRGRARGLGVTLITQRPAVLNKNVLTQVEVLLALQVTAPQDRAALDEWAKGWSTPEQRQEFLAGLATLRVGEAWVWSPSWLEVFRRVNIRERRTFDSSATPKMGEARVEPKVLAAVDLDALKVEMADTIERAKADDPKVLRARLREVEQALAVAEADATRLRAETCSVVEVEVIPAGLGEAVAHMRAMHEASRSNLRGDLDRLGETYGLVVDACLDDLVAQIESVSDDTRRREAQPAAAGTQVVPSGDPRGVRHGAEARRSSPSGPGSASARGTDRPTPTRTTDYAPRAGAKRMLAALAQYPAGLRAAQVATFAKVKRSGGTFSTYASELQRNGCITIDGAAATGVFRITDVGMDVIGGVPLPADPAELRAEWRERLKAAGAKRMFDHLVDIYPQWCSRESLAAETGITLNAGTFSTYLSRMRSNGLIEEGEDALRAHPDLFMGGS